MADFKIEIQDNVMEAFNAFDNLKRHEVFRAASVAINRTLVTLRKESIEIIKKDLKIQSSVLKSKYIFLNRAKGSHISNISGSLVFQSRGLPLIDFMSGARVVTPQKGIPVRKRKTIRAEVTPGKRFVVAQGFVINTASKGLQIMKRDKKSNGRLLMQTAPSLGRLLLNENKQIGSHLQARGAELFQTNFQHELAYRVQAMVANMKPA